MFTAGISLFGVADLKLLADDTHKFESQYLFKVREQGRSERLMCILIVVSQLIGGTPAEVRSHKTTGPLTLLTSSRQVPAIYHDRSPLFKAERIKAALLVMQGLDDKVVPPEQGKSSWALFADCCR